MTSKNKKIKIEDNFLKQENFDEVKKNLTGKHFPWFISNFIDFENDVPDKFQFTHVFYFGGAPQSSYMELANYLVKAIQPLSVYRIKANLLTKTPNIVENVFHVDIGNLENSPEILKQWTTSIFYVNTNNGYTLFENGTKVESVANRMVTFPSNMKHTGTSCTDKKYRIVINFNYFEDPTDW